MANKIPIDDLFRNGLSHGEEPMNLGAWANMERMLNGEDPYENPEKRKRRFAPWIWGACVLTAISGAILLWQNSSHKSDKIPLVTQQQVSDTQEQARVEAGSADGQSVPTTQASGLTAENESGNTTPQQQGQSNVSVTQQAKTPKTSNVNTSNASALSKKQTSYQSDPQAIDQSDRVASKKNQKNLSGPTSTVEGEDNHDQPMFAANPNKKSNKRSLNNKEASANTELAMHTAGKQQLSNDHNELPVPLAAESMTKVEPKTKKITKVELTEQVQRDRTGMPIRNIFDTVSITRSEEVRAERTPNSITPDASGTYHPRYVVLNATQEAQAQQQRALISPTVIDNNSKMAQAETVIQSSSKSKPEVNTDISSKADKPYVKSKESTFSRLRTKAAVFNDDFAAKLGKSCPGMTMGVHAAINNPQNNFGGFQFGLNNLKPFGDYFSLLTEVKFFLRNNSGYTIRDIMTTNRNLSMDTISVQGHRVYAFQVDSSSYLYNFKHFASIEMPLVMQFHYRRLTAYAGLNLAYQFRLQTSTVQRNYVVNHADTIANGSTFALPFEKGRDITKDDFKARLGLGMLGGMSYSFNPQLYVDLRLVQNLNDNARTLSARAVSENTFKVPSIQLSLGYRFRKFTPAQ